MMHFRPGRVRLDRTGAWGRRKVFGRPTEGLGAINVEGMRMAVPLDMEDVAPPQTGSLSDPGLGTAERGRMLLEHAVESCAKFLRWFREIDPYLRSGPLPPRPRTKDD